MAIFQFSKLTPAGPASPTAAAKSKRGSIAIKQTPVRSGMLDQDLTALATETAKIKFGNKLPTASTPQRITNTTATNTGAVSGMAATTQIGGTEMPDVSQIQVRNPPSASTATQTTAGGFAAGAGVNPIGDQQTANQPVNPTVTTTGGSAAGAQQQATVSPIKLETTSPVIQRALETIQNQIPPDSEAAPTGVQVSTDDGRTEAGESPDTFKSNQPLPGDENIGTDMDSITELARQTALKQMEVDLQENAAKREEALGQLKEGEAAALQRGQEISDVGAMGLTGAGQMMQSDLGRIGRRSTTLAMDEFERTQRQAEADKLAAGIGQAGDVQKAQFEAEAFKQAQAALGEAPNIVSNPDGSMTQTLEDGTKVTYDAQGNEIRRINAAGESVVNPEIMTQRVTEEQKASAAQVSRAEANQKEESGEWTRVNSTLIDGGSGSMIYYRDAQGNLYMAPMPQATS